jgi:xanthine dehydrogenase accessory protein XdhC
MDNGSPSAAPLAVLATWHARREPTIVATISRAEGSTPREEGAWMAVTRVSVIGTIGGGRLEWDVVAAARARLAAGEDRLSATVVSIPLGPEIGQCCGGRVEVRLDALDNSILSALAAREEAIAMARPDVFIFGAGHVGRALARALAPLPFRTTLVDERRDELALAGDVGVRLMCVDRPSALVAEARSGAAHVVMTHSHALDALIATEVLDRADFGYLGLIGSATKKALFLKGFREAGVPESMIARIVCPVGGSAVGDKRPEVIAALVAAEITTAMFGR